MNLARIFLALVLFAQILPLHAFDWEQSSVNGRDYVTLHSFCTFYGFSYQDPSGNDYFKSHSATHTLSFKHNSSEAYIDGVHYVLSFPVEDVGHDWLISRLDVIKLFEPILRPENISGRHTIRGVVIDAGHGGTDNGAVSSRGGMEKVYTKDTAYRLKDILESQGIDCVLTRRTDVYVDLYERARIASLYSNYIFVSIHFNSATPEAHGLETYCLSPRGSASTSSAYLMRSDAQKLPGNDYDALNILLASKVHKEIIKLNPGDAAADRGVKRARFVVIKQNVLPAILVEGGFVSNRMEAATINTAAYRQKLAAAIARGIDKFINVMGGRKIPLPDDGVQTSPTIAVNNSTDNSDDTSIKKKSKDKKTTDKTTSASPNASQTNQVVQPTLSPAIVSTPSSSNPNPSLNLAEPLPPPPTPGSENAPPEPDEPPVVNIYPTTSAMTNATPVEAPEPEAPATNQVVQPVPQN